MDNSKIMEQLHMTDFSEKAKKKKEEGVGQENSLKKIEDNEITFSIPLEYGQSDRGGEREVIHEVKFEKGICRIDGREVRFAEAGAEVIKHNKHHLLDEQKRRVLGIDKLLAKIKDN